MTMIKTLLEREWRLWNWKRW